MSAPNDNQQNVTWHEFADDLAALVKKILPELDVELLAANKPSHRHKGNSPPRERNSFFIYKSHRWIYYRKQYKARGEKIHVPEVTKKMSADWHALPAQEQKKWRLAAILQQYNHRKAYQNYKYNPNRGTQKKATKRPRADGEGGRTRKKICNEKRADHPSIESQGMMLEFSVNVNPPSIDDQLVQLSNDHLLDDPVEFQALWNEFTNETEPASELDTKSPDVNAAEQLVNMNVEPLATNMNMEPLAMVSADQVPDAEAFSFINYDGSSTLMQFNANDLPNLLDVDLNQFASLDDVYNVNPVSPTPTTPMLSNDASPILHDMSPTLSESSLSESSLSESSPHTIVPQNYDGAGINTMGQATSWPYEYNAFNGLTFDGQYLNQFSDFTLSALMLDDATPSDPAAGDWFNHLAANDS